jgi:hypothetical protein
LVFSFLGSFGLLAAMGAGEQYKPLTLIDNSLPSDTTLAKFTRP